MALHVHQALAPQIEAEPGLAEVYRRIEMPTSAVLARIERAGVLIDSALLATQSRELAERILALESEAFALAGQPFNLGSPKQIGEILFGKLGLPVGRKTASGAPSTDEEVLAELAKDYPLPARLLEHRGLSKLKGTYTDKLPLMVNPATGRVHTTYAQAVAVTGRLSSNDPNLQNIPIRTAEGRRVREAFIAPEGASILSADYSQIELRIMAHLSADAGLLHAFGAGIDVHRATAAEVFAGGDLEAVSAEQRRFAKVINFGLIYGMSAFGLARTSASSAAPPPPTSSATSPAIPGVKRYMDETRAGAIEKGFVETLFGRRVHLPEIRKPGPRRSAAERQAINAPMQGTAADLIKLAMIAVQDAIDRESRATRMIMQVHDELVFEVPAAEIEWAREAVPRIMAGVATLAVPLSPTSASARTGTRRTNPRTVCRLGDSVVLLEGLPLSFCPSRAPDPADTLPLPRSRDPRRATHGNADDRGAGAAGSEFQERATARREGRVGPLRRHRRPRRRFLRRRVRADRRADRPQRRRQDDALQLPVAPVRGQ